MFASAHLIRSTTAADAAVLNRMAVQSSRAPLAGRILVGLVDGTPAAAISITDGGVIADPSRSTGHVRAWLRVRAAAVRAHAATPSVRQRIVEGIRVARTSRIVVEAARA